MKVNQGGTTVTGKVTHAVFGEWTYTGINVPWCTNSIILSGVEHHVASDVEVTCKRCLKVVPTYPKETRNLAFEVKQLWNGGFDTGPHWLVKARSLFASVDGVAGMTAIQVARIVLSGNRESSEAGSQERATLSQAKEI